ncbi:SDR family oxidoreductase [Paenibacillus sp. HN-1]|uniref:SDR family NAD(P)-dependent oxidoreductase n=1 Tax=Paenibacillus TaxID=44249 RepID=UPI001CA8F50D|nr:MULTISPECIES: SDR family oxidoreductase [Paenibacillus]MBY9081802.1 SDR family oxidoreductase [Paenibacillus sp. CGMCC 1.18879]MBY9086521.1 SDR family oxidoreductase [Paenibacillus sinensis]
MDANDRCDTCTLITGASGGIGIELAEAFAKRGANLVLVARRQHLLKEASTRLMERYPIRVLWFTCDLSEKEAPRSINEWCKSQNIIIDTLVNNAGAGMFGEFDHLDIDEQIRMIELNIHALVKLTHHFLPDLMTVSKGSILNVASIAALYPLPYYSVYGATKAFVLSFTEALRYEMRHTKLKISCLCPGDTDTNFFHHAGNENKKTSLMSPQQVAEIAVMKLMENVPVIFPGSMKLVSKIPGFILRRIVFRRVTKYKLP